VTKAAGVTTSSVVATDYTPARERVLVVEDETYLADVLRTGLGFVGFDVLTVNNGTDALATLHDFNPQLILLDVMLPDIDGFSLCMQIRSATEHVGIIFLTARDASEDAIHGLGLGADDYITKPFSLNEVVARMRSVLRRVTVSQTGQPTQDSVLRYADLELDDDRHEFRRAGEVIELAPTEFSLLRYLIANSERVVSKRQILQHVWHYEFHGDGSIIESYISYLRKKIDTPERQPLIHTLRGVGYSLRTTKRSH
jgi:two-component system OmpR family response regulator